MIISAEFLKKANACDSLAKFEELLKANDMELSSKEAESLFAQIHEASELSDESLEAVAGGAPVHFFIQANDKKAGFDIHNTIK